MARVLSCGTGAATVDIAAITLARLDLSARVGATERQARRDDWTLPERCSGPPSQEIWRRNVGQLADGGCLKLATAYHRMTQSLPCDNH